MNLVNFLNTILHNCPTTQRFWIAYSGGLDSHVLLHLMAELRPQLPNAELRAVHIHHGLQLQADEWVTHCETICTRLKIPCTVIRVNARAKVGESPEECARIARYTAITQLLAPNDVVLTAQHADDQAETVLLQLLRGAGVAGLSAMPQLSRLGQGWLLRPLLNYSREQLHVYAQQVELHWIEDMSNTDIRFQRNFIRHEIVPHLRKNWAVSHNLSRVAQHQAEANELLQELAQQDLQHCQTAVDAIDIKTLSCLTPARQRNMIRYWLKNIGLPLPSTAQLQHILKDMLTARHDRQPLVRWTGAEIRRYRNQLFAMSNLPTLPNAQYFYWSLSDSLQLPLGKLTAHATIGQGLVVPPETVLQVRFRQGGERFFWHEYHHTVKKLLQTTPIPPWQRSFIPLIYLENILVAIPNVGINDHFLAQSGKMGWILQWVRIQNLKSE